MLNAGIIARVSTDQQNDKGSLDIEIYKNNQKLDQLDLLFKSEKKYWYDEANQRIYIDKEKDLKEYLEKKAKKK